MTRDNPCPQKVGYKVPPTEHRFKAGASGNPNGRPRKLRAPPAVPPRSMHEVVREEAHRKVAIRENSRETTLTTLHAMMRSMVLAGVKGDRHAQAAFADLLAMAERENLEQKKIFFETAVAYKRHYAELFRKCDRERQPRPEPIPHPDDLVADSQAGEIIINGPFDEVDRAIWAKYQQRKQDALDEIAVLRRMQVRDNSRRDRYSRFVAREQRVVDLIDRNFPDEAIRRNPAFNLSKSRRIPNDAFEANESSLRLASRRQKNQCAFD